MAKPSAGSNDARVVSVVMMNASTSKGAHPHPKRSIAWSPLFPYEPSSAKSKPLCALILEKPGGVGCSYSSALRCYPRSLLACLPVFAKLERKMCP